MHAVMAHIVIPFSLYMDGRAIQDTVADAGDSWILNVDCLLHYLLIGVLCRVNEPAAIASPRPPQLGVKRVDHRRTQGHPSTQAHTHKTLFALSLPSNPASAKNARSRRFNNRSSRGNCCDIRSTPTQLSSYVRPQSDINQDT